MKKEMKKVDKQKIPERNDRVRLVVNSTSSRDFTSPRLLETDKKENFQSFNHRLGSGSDFGFQPYLSLNIARGLQLTGIPFSQIQIQFFSSRESDVNPVFT